jgi:hypothetical protein
MFYHCPVPSGPPVSYRFSADNLELLSLICTEQLANAMPVVQGHDNDQDEEYHNDDGWSQSPEQRCPGSLVHFVHGLEGMHEGAQDDDVSPYPTGGQIGDKRGSCGNQMSLLPGAGRPK